MTSFAPPPPIDKFVGRRVYLDLLKEKTNRFNIIGVLGPGGIGKTSLLRQFLAENRFNAFWISAYQDRINRENFDLLLDELSGTRRSKGPIIVVIDGAEAVDHIESYVINLLDTKRPESIVFTSRKLLNFAHENIELLPLTMAESVDLISRIVPVGVDRRDIYSLAARVNGHPLALVLIGELLKSQTVEQVLYQLEGGWNDLELSLPAGNQSIAEIVAPKIIIANDVIIERLKRTPEDLHKISPRKFEELIAELIQDMGWEIELTPQSKDGGKDIIAALHTDLGRFLCLIEAKHYNPSRPVQVGLVKQLYGTFIDEGANSAMLVTSSTFTKGAKEFQSKHEYQLSLRDYSDIIKWIQNYGTKDRVKRSF